MSVTASDPHRMVIVGGGSGGLKLATRLGRRYRRDAGVRVTLVDASLTHVWKPLLHEIAAGTLDIHDDECDYIAHARAHHFTFVWGRMDGLDCEARRVHLAPLHEADGREALPARALGYDTLVIAVGSVGNDFGVPGVAEHCFSLESADEAETFRRGLLEAYLRAGQGGGPATPGELDVAIVGAGATGVELAAELDKMRHELADYGACDIDVVHDTRLVIIERAPRLLPGLPQDIADATRDQLRRLGVETRTGEAVAEVTADGIQVEGGDFIPARFRVWAAGVKAPAFLGGIGGLETNARDQLVVGRTLQTTRDANVFALGDCAACPRDAEGSALVPPRAQAADQQAAFLARALPRHLAGEDLPEYVYRDRGSLVNVSDSAFGTLMGALLGNVTIEGWFARASYRWLYRDHQRALHGPIRALALLLSDLVSRRTRPRLKLH
ncbi:MAG: NAD(P)/FAD-dependent oxidoreductase [Halofilum sp. (in: g-proteobacteria)]|nr:NAD(P)/FAD-dependent oxidoreductase [Halofilum sp. (in: g-proteobacteria)]